MKIPLHNAEVNNDIIFSSRDVIKQKTRIVDRPESISDKSCDYVD